MVQPGQSEPDLDDLGGSAAEDLFAGLYSQIQAARMEGHLQASVPESQAGI